MLRHLMFATAAVAFVAGNASAQQWAEKMFEKQKHDFGSVARASKCVVSFPIKNLYKEDVHISGLTVSCSCTSAEITKKDLKTFETGEIVATFKTSSFVGHKGADIKVTIDKPYFAEVRLRVDGEIRTDVVFDPPQVDLGNVDMGNTIEKRIQVRYAGRSDWEIKDITSNNKNFEVSMSKPTRSGNRTDYELVVRLKNDATAGYIKDVLTLVTNDSATQRVPLYVEGRVMPALTVSPASLFFGTLKPGQTATKLMIVQGKTPFKITDIACEDQSFKFKTSDEAAALHRVPVTFTAPTRVGKVTQNIVVRTDAGSATGTCQVWAMIEPAPQTAAADKPVTSKP